jgi:MFS family permease
LGSSIESDPTTGILGQNLHGPESEAPPSLVQVASSMWSMFATKRFLIFAPQLFWTGISIAYFSGNLVEMMTRTIEGTVEEQFAKSNYAMIFFGLGEVFGCFFIGYIVDKYGSKPAGYVNILIMALMGIVTLIYAI